MLGCDVSLPKWILPFAVAKSTAGHRYARVILAFFRWGLRVAENRFMFAQLLFILSPTMTFSRDYLLCRLKAASAHLGICVLRLSSLFVALLLVPDVRAAVKAKFRSLPKALCATIDPAFIGRF